MLLVGPSSAGQPSTSNSWWVAFVKYVVANKVVPDQWTWHDEPGDVAKDHDLHIVTVEVTAEWVHYMNFL